ncbi:MAG: hypothetical protein IJJ40_05995 [Clostridia bacterium]|nr:hypothetical protein [Clostridia bacterium]
MLKALYKKQFMEMYCGLFKNRKTGKPFKTGGIIALGLLLLFSYLSLGLFFFMLADSMTAQFSGSSIEYLPFTVMGIAAFSVCLYVIGIYSNTMLYGAKDNELLLSLPIPPSKILLVRISVLYISCLFLSSLVLVPTFIAFLIEVKVTAAIIAGGVFGILLFSLLATTFSAVLGFIIAYITSKVKRKNMVSVFLTLSFLALYYYFYFKSRSIISSIVANGEKTSKAIKKWGYIFYLFGKASSGKILYLFIFAIISAVLFCLLIFVLSKTFYKVTGGVAKKGKTRKTKTVSKINNVNKAMLKREFSRFFSSTVYLINVGLGSIIMLLGAVAVIIFGRDINKAIALMLNAAPHFIVQNIEYLKNLAIIVISAFAGSMVYYTAPSISMEGKSFWIIRTAPIKAKSVLNAKIKAHLILAGIPGVILTLTASIVLRVGIICTVTNSLFTLSFILFIGALGLGLNLKMPNLDWNDESVPVKQSMPVTITFFVGFIAVILLAFIGFVSKLFLIKETLGLFLSVPLVLASFIMLYRINKNAEKTLLSIG